MKRHLTEEQWDGAKLGQLRRLLSSGLSLDAIAREIGRRVPEVEAAAYFLGMERKKLKRWHREPKIAVPMPFGNAREPPRGMR